MNFIKKLYHQFSVSDSFESDPYAWITNQISHISFSFVICYLTGMWHVIGLLWIYWELKHYKESKDKKDLIEDLFFELSGVFIFLFGDIPLIISVLVLIVLFSTRVYKN